MDQELNTYQNRNTNWNLEWLKNVMYAAKNFGLEYLTGMLEVDVVFAKDSVAVVTIKTACVLIVEINLEKGKQEGKIRE
jgi:hypothetical protein